MYEYINEINYNIPQQYKRMCALKTNAQESMHTDGKKCAHYISCLYTTLLLWTLEAEPRGCKIHNCCRYLSDFPDYAFSSYTFSAIIEKSYL